jgi:hypothetical protein
MKQLSLDLHDIQDDVLEDLPKDYEDFTFYKIINPAFFKKTLEAARNQRNHRCTTGA